MFYTFTQFLKYYQNLLFWIAGFAVNIFIAFSQYNTGVFENTLAIASGKSLGSALCAFVLVRVAGLFKGRQFIDRWLPILFLIISILIR